MSTIIENLYIFFKRDGEWRGVGEEAPQSFLLCMDHSAYILPKNQFWLAPKFVYAIFTCFSNSMIELNTT